MAVNGVEVAHAYLSITVKSPALAKSLTSVLDKVDVSNQAKRIGKQFTDAAGKSLKATVIEKFAAATSAALDKQGAATKRLSDAEHELVKARAQHGNTNAKIAAAEEKLAALRKSGKASTADLQTAEAALAKAQADHISTGRAVAGAQNTVTEAKRNATEASKAYADALAREKSKSEQALAWMPLASERIQQVSDGWKSAGAQISGVGDQLTNSITKPAVTAGGVVATLLGALGFKRLVGIDTARGQFKGFGMDVDAVMKQVDAGVTNTSLSMAQGASAAVGILATGNVPLQELEAQIKRVANVSAAYGIEAEHANYLLNLALVKGKVEWGDLSQMQQNQIPIVTQLADYYGVAGGEIMTMAQDGRISVEDLNKVLDLNAGQAAKSYAETWKGVTANILANLSKISAKFLEPSFQIMKEQAGEFLAFIKTPEFAQFATDIGAKIAQMVTQAVDGLKTLVGWWNGLSAEQKKAIGVTAGIVVAMGPVLKIVGGLVSGIGALITTAQFAIGLVTGYKAAVGGAALASDVLTGATKSQTVAMNLGALASKAWAGATWLAAKANKGLLLALNLIKGHPIIAAISLIVGALVWFFSETEIGKKIFAEFTRFLGEAWANISAFFTAAYENVIRPVFEGIKTVLQTVGSFFVTVWQSYLKPVFDGIAQVAQWVWLNILQPIFQAFQLGFAVLGGIIAGVWEYILKPVFDAIGAIFRWLWDTIISVVINLIMIQVKAWGAAFTWLYETILKPVFDAIATVFRWIYQNVIVPVINGIKVQIRAWAMIAQWLYAKAIKPALEAIAAVFKWIWANIIGPIVGWIQEKIRILGLAFGIMYAQHIKPAWDRVASIISTVWGKVKSVIDTMSRVIKTDPKKAFEMARDAIGLAWKGIQELAKKPVKFVVETVIGGMIDSVNGFLPKGMKLPKPKLPKGFRTGGKTPDVGYNNVAGVVHGSEFVTRAESTKKIQRNHPGVLEHMNRYGEIPGYRKGGLVSPLKNYAVSQPFHGGHNGIDLAAPMGTPIMAAASGVAQMVRSVPMGGNEIYLQHAGLGTRYSHLSRFSTREGQKVRQGQVIGYVGSTGMSTGPHLHYMVHNPSDGGAGRFYRNFVNPAPYLTGAGKQLGEAAPSAGSILDGLVDFAVSKVKAAFPDGGMWIDIATGLARNAASAMTKAFNPFAASDGHTALKPMLYDQGGWLPPGLSLVNNKTGVPEPVFNRPDFDDLIGGRGGSLDGTRMVLVLDDGRELGGYVREIADDAVDRGFEDLEAAGRRVGV